MNIPIYKITLGGRDLTSVIAPRLVQLNLTETRGDDADTLDITIDDSDGKIALPSRGAVLDVAFGWQDTGLVQKGKFKVDEIEHSGAPDTLQMRARSASLSKGLGERKEKSWHNVNLDTIVKTIAKQHGLVPLVASEIGKINIAHIDQTHESDMSFLTRIAKRYDAVMNVKDNNLLFMPIGKGQTVSGKALSVLKITRADGDRHRYHVAERESYEAVRAFYHSTGKAKKKSVTIGGENNRNNKVLPETYATEAEARAAAQAEFNRVQRNQATFNLTLALGRADVFPEMPVTVTGFKPEIDATPWLIKSAAHSIADTFTTTLDFEMRDDPTTKRHRSAIR